MDEDNPNCIALEREHFQEAKDINIDDIRESHLRCGEVYMDGTENFKFVCMLCEKSFFTNIGEFIIHVTNCESTIENLTLESVEVVDIERITLKEDSTNSSDVGTENSKLEDPVEEFLSSHNESESSETNDNKLENVDTNESIGKETQNIFSCSYCDKKYLYNDSLKRHLKQAHCENSIKKTTNEKNENKPTLTKGEFPCSYCVKKYFHKDSLRRHLRNEHPETVTKQSIYFCYFPNCECKFHSKEDLQIHKKYYDHKAIDTLISNSKQANEQLEHNENDSFEKNSINFAESGKFDDCKCKFCGKYFRTENLRKVHELTHKGVKPYKCHLCNLTFLQKHNLKFHIKRHLGQKNLPCRFCGKLFFVNCERESHEQVHTGEKPFQCSECGNCYVSLSRLNLHIKVKHSSYSKVVKQYKCDDCDRIFSSKYTLSRHFLTHTGEKSFECEICQSKFSTKSVLRQHKKIHSNIAEYICKVCGKGFKQKPGLYGHMKSHGEIST